HVDAGVAYNLVRFVREHVGGEVDVALLGQVADGDSRDLHVRSGPRRHLAGVVEQHARHGGAHVPTPEQSDTNTFRHGTDGRARTRAEVGVGEGWPLPDTNQALAPRSVPSFFCEIFATSAFGATRQNAPEARSQSDRLILARSERVSSKCRSRSVFSSARCSGSGRWGSTSSVFTREGSAASGSYT